MRVLIVDAFSGSSAGRTAFKKFDELVRSAFKTIERHEYGRTEFVVRHFGKGLEVYWWGLSHSTRVAESSFHIALG